MTFQASARTRCSSIQIFDCVTPHLDVYHSGVPEDVFTRGFARPLATFSVSCFIRDLHGHHRGNDCTQEENYAFGAAKVSSRAPAAPGPGERWCQIEVPRGAWRALYQVVLTTLLGHISSTDTAAEALTQMHRRIFGSPEQHRRDDGRKQRYRHTTNRCVRR